MGLPFRRLGSHGTALSRRKWLRSPPPLTVRGVIVAKTITENLRYSIAVVPNVSLFEYEVSFALKPAQAFGAHP
jgi:hypothetical protein